MGIIDSLANFVKYYASSIALLITWATLIWVYWHKRSNWLRKHFIDQVNFSLNYMHDGQLFMRTLAEMHARNVWLNDLGVKKVIQAATLTTKDQPFVRLADQADMEFVYRAVLNVLSEKFAEAYLAEQLGVPIKSAAYRFAITMERYDDIRTLKLRVLLVEENELETWFGPEPPNRQTIRYESSHYEARLRTLRAMNELHRNASDPKTMKLGRVVLSVKL